MLSVILGTFPNCEKRLLASPCLSAATGWIFIKFDIWDFFRKSVEKFQVLLIYDQNYLYFTWILFIFMIISRRIILKMRCFRYVIHRFHILVIARVLRICVSDCFRKIGTVERRTPVLLSECAVNAECLINKTGREACNLPYGLLGVGDLQFSDMLHTWFRACYRFQFDNEPIRNLFTVCRIVDTEWIKTPGNRILNFLRHFSYNFLLCIKWYCILANKTNARWTVTGSRVNCRVWLRH